MLAELDNSDGSDILSIAQTTRSVQEHDDGWMTIVDLIKGSELQLSPIPDLKADFEKLTSEFFSDLEKSGSENATGVRSKISKYEQSCEELAVKFAKKKEER